MAFKRLDAQDFVVSAEAVQSVAWSTGAPTISEFYDSTTQKASPSGNYYLSVYQTASDDSAAAVQFDITYGNLNGSGSTAYNSGFGLVHYTPSSTIYGQYRSLVLEDENSTFTFGDGTNLITSSDFWALSIERARYKEKLYPGTFNLTLKSGSNTIQLTDNSNEVLTQTFIGTTRVLQIVSGSNGNAYTSTGYVAGSGSYGLFLPDIGTILLNPYAISQSIRVSPNRNSGVANGENNATLFTAISGGASFQLNSEETITSDYVFVRSRNAEFNYSENPSFISGSTGEVIYSQFIDNPQVYVTTVGMYNDANELVAVAKLSKPLLKDFTKESLVRVKLDF
jgi:hypothetical protein